MLVLFYTLISNIAPNIKANKFYKHKGTKLCLLFLVYGVIWLINIYYFSSSYY